MIFVGSGGNIAIAIRSTPIILYLYCKHQIVDVYNIFYFLCLPEASVSGCGDFGFWMWRLTLARCLYTTL